ncbi:MAG: carboxypeptidase regulatory-like domain-containing protein, partial [Polaromonas sp.]|nr:carboxypeptidase regulatory-like domain-containing protein [Gemmatimonadaceae bacterium]
MKTKLPERRSFWSSPARGLRTAWLSLVLALGVSGTALAQQVTVSGTVRNAAGAPLAGVLVRLSGTDTRSTTNTNGRYVITAP